MSIVMVLFLAFHRQCKGNEIIIGKPYVTTPQKRHYPPGNQHASHFSYLQATKTC